ncbi:MAG TPA: hypothetical protein VGO58_18515 [Chitinophagaceae bacterium]|jgi:hypothetical protein|nr:hypothetical protein [Chitinophagaceae bacterium]
MKTKNCFLISLFVLVSSYAFANNYFTPGTGVRWTLDNLVANSGGDVTFSAGVYNVNDTVFISQNDTLSISVDATVKFAANTYFDVNGVLLINPPNNVTFTAQNTATRYLGMRIDSSHASVLRKLTFEYANSLRLFDCNPLIENCIFRLNSPLTTFGNAAISLFRSNPIIRNCQFIDNQRAAIQGGANIANAPVITGCLFQGNNILNQNVPQINLGTSGTDTVKIINNQLLRASTNSGAIGFLPIGNVQALITGNVIRNNRYGITFNGGSNINTMISYNVIDSNNTQGDPNLGGSGIAFSGGTASSQQNAIVTGNTFTANLWGITIQNRAKPNLGNITNADTSDNGKNRFINNNNLNTPHTDLYNNTIDPIMAQNNYWNTNDPAVVETRIFHTPDLSTLGLVNYSGFITLPVDFVFLTATPSGSNVLLDWQTIYEAGSSYFVVERGLDGASFDSIGKIVSGGTAYSTLNYSFIDIHISYFNKPIYYRVKLVNADGSFKYSTVAIVTVPLDTRGQSVRLYSNIFGNSSYTAEVVSSTNQTIRIRVYDVSGRLLRDIPQPVLAGTNRFPLGLPSYLPAGWLYVKFSGEGIAKTIPVLKR